MTFIPDELAKTREVIVSFLNNCGMAWPTVEYDQGFDSLCRAEAVERGYPVEGPNSLARFIPMGVVMSTTAYAHLKNDSTRIFIALYTASLIYIDDVFQHDVDAVRDFNRRFVLLKPHGDKVLDCFTTLLLEAPKHFNKVGANLITTSTLNLVTAMLLEYETKGMPIGEVSHGYPGFARTLSGATEAYALFVFPSELGLTTYIQAIPEMMIYLNYGNDLLSFHKEEIAGESVNYISLLAAQRRLSKHQALWNVASVIEDCHKRIRQILKSQPAALEAYNEFATGYLGFHAGLPRYKLGDLRLDSSN